jgi:hypothetical protein
MIKMLTDKVEDDLLHQIDLSDTDSIKAMVSLYATSEPPEVKQARTAALSSIARRQIHHSHWAAITAVRTAMYHRANVIGSFSAYVAYDTAVVYALDELLAVYSHQDLLDRHYEALHAAWRYQLDALSVEV